MFISCSLSVISQVDNDYGYGKISELLGDHPISIATLCCFDKISSIETMIYRDTEDHIRVAWEKLLFAKFDLNWPSGSIEEDF